MTFVSERFTLPEAQKNDMLLRPTTFGFNGLGEAVYLRTYSRLKTDGTQEVWADTVTRVVEGVMSIAKDYHVKNHLPWHENEWTQTARTMADFIFDMKFLPPGRGLWAMGTQYVYERGSAALQNCFAGNTEFLSQEGIFALQERVGERVSVLTSSGWKEANIRSFGKQETQEIVLRPYIKTNTGKWMTVNSNVRKQFTVTPTHRWFLHNGETTQNLSVGDIVLSQKHTPITDENFTAGIRHGLIFGDGCKEYTYKNGEFLYATYVDGRTSEYSHLFNRVSYPASQKGAATARFRSAEELKQLPRGKDANYIAGFIEGWFLADGKYTSANKIISTQNEEAAKWLQAHAPYAGYIATGVSLETKDTNYGPRKNGLYAITLNNSEVAWKVESIAKATQQEVFCAVVPEEHAFTLDAGVYTSNCGFVDVKLLSHDAAWAMDMLMCGVGIGFSTDKLQHCSFSLPVKSTMSVHDAEQVVLQHTFYNDKTQGWELTPEGQRLADTYFNEHGIYFVPDNREGWVQSVQHLIASYEERNRNDVRFSYWLVRPAGAPINGFGGTASGPTPLRKAHRRLRTVLTATAKYTGENVPDYAFLIADVMNIIGACVVAGNVRRSAELATGLPSNANFINMKNYGTADKKGPAWHRRRWGWMSNNSILLRTPEDFLALPDIAEQIRSNGEPGIINMMNVEKYGRFKDKTYGPDYARGFNPCAEQPLESFELCNLVEVFPTRCTSESEIYTAMRLATLWATIVSLLPTHRPETNRVMQRNHRIGVSVSGVADFVETTSVAHVTRVLRNGYEKVVRPTNSEYAGAFGIPRSVRVTTVKPSGTISLLAGVSPGMHWPTDAFAIRRVRISEAHALVPVLKQAGYRWEKDLTSDNTLCFEFPVDQSQARSTRQVSMWEQLSMAAFLQREWSDNGVSCTIYFDPKREGHDIEQALSMYAPQIKAISMLPHTEEGVYAQMPYEGITREKYKELKAAIKPINAASFLGSGSSDGLDARFCQNDSCAVAF